MLKTIINIFFIFFITEARNQAAEDETPEEQAEEGSALEVTLGGEVQLECPAGSLSCWGRSKHPGQHLEPLGPGPKLTLGNVVYQEAGEYKCFVGRNSKMEKWRSRSVQVNVVGKYSGLFFLNTKLEGTLIRLNRND